MEPYHRAPEPMTKLPPLILHPFADAQGPAKLVESSRANLMLQGLLPQGDFSAEELERRLLEGRFCEIRMLFYVGKDVDRWIEQCLEFVERDEALAGLGYQYQSFADFLVNRPPKPVKDKLKRWGVADYRAIFSRAIAIRSIFAEAPLPENLTTHFIRHYYRYADQIFECRQRTAGYPVIAPEQFDFDLYASAEYARILEQEWERS